MRLHFFEIYKRGFWRARSLALSKHAIKYGTQSGFPYCNLTTPPLLPIKGFPLFATWGCAE